MDPSYNFPQDDYALTILTQAAMHSSQTSNSNNSGLDKEHPAPRNVTRAGLENASTSAINNPNDHAVNSRGEQSKLPQDILDDYSPSGTQHTMEALAFNPNPLQRQSAYMNPGYQGIGAQISHNYANSLRILNADSYDDGRGTLTNHDDSHMRLRQQKERTMPFGLMDRPKMGVEPEVYDSDEREGGTREGGTKRRRKQAKNDSGDEDEDARKKARGRPRVDTKDETAADRRRTQIRMAQRAYRHRKETTISSLEKQVQDLRGTNEEMSNIFINLYDFAIAKGLLQREPEFGQQLQSTTERFLALAKSTQEENAEENHEEVTKSGDAEPETGRRAKGRRASPKKRQEATPPVSEPAVPAWGGYELSKEDNSIEAIDLGYSQQTTNWRNALQVITRPTEENASFPFDLMDLQTYRVEIPQIEDFSQDFFPESQLPLPSTHNYSEFSFARRIHRAAIETAFKLITSNDPSEAERRQQVFGFCLLYESPAAIEARLLRVMGNSVKETLQEWRAPFVHLGGSGTYYPMDSTDTNDLMPKFRTGYSMGPFSHSISNAQEILEEDMECKLPGFEGHFFDPNDVEGYLRGRGLDIVPAAEYVTGELDLSSLTEIPSPKSSTDSVTSIVSPKTPQSPVGSITHNLNPDAPTDFDFFKETSISKPTTLPFPQGFASWDEPMEDYSNNGFVGPIFTTMPKLPGRATPELTLTDRRHSKRTVTVHVQTLLDELLKRGVCLGRAPGFRPSDVNLAILAAVNVIL